LNEQPPTGDVKKAPGRTPEQLVVPTGVAVLEAMRGQGSEIGTRTPACAGRAVGASVTTSAASIET
jgi:hypothetical protein